MPQRTAKKAAAVFRLHVELEDVTPAIWRTLLVPSNITLADLHAALNEVLGWTNSHLHQFILGGRRVGGVRACPPEDCGGAAGYEHLLEVLGDEGNEEHDDFVTWVGGHFNPEGFDVNRTNAGLLERCR